MRGEVWRRVGGHDVTISLPAPLHRERTHAGALLCARPTGEPSARRVTKVSGSTPLLSDAQIMVTSRDSPPRRLSYDAVAATVSICWALATWADFAQIPSSGASFTRYRCFLPPSSAPGGLG